MNVTYNGKHANVAVVIDGREVAAARGETIEVTEAQAKRLAKLAGWTRVQAIKPEEA